MIIFVFQFSMASWIWIVNYSYCDLLFLFLLMEDFTFDENLVESCDFPPTFSYILSKSILFIYQNRNCLFFYGFSH
jgi:hypothetical protein